jgi:hypothetical protein
MREPYWPRTAAVAIIRPVMRLQVSPLALLLLGLMACGDPGLRAPAPLSVTQALSGNPEQLEFEAPASRQELFAELARRSQLEAGRPASTAPVLFAFGRDGALVGAPALAPHADLLQTPDAGSGLLLSFEGNFERWPEDRRDSLQGLSEREAAELVARTLLHLWGVHPGGQVQVERAQGAPYAAAWLDGILRLNPALLYLASAQGLPPAGLTGP